MVLVQGFMSFKTHERFNPQNRNIVTLEAVDSTFKFKLYPQSN